jgi:hypothetical protein
LVPQSLIAMFTGGPALNDERPAASPVNPKIETIPEGKPFEEIKTVPEIETSH